MRDINLLILFNLLKESEIYKSKLNTYIHAVNTFFSLKILKHIQRVFELLYELVDVCLVIVYIHAGSQATRHFQQTV